MWLADWSDSENADFRAACEAAQIPAVVLRSRALGPTVGRAAHRLRSWPAYASLALRGLAIAGARPLVAWQPLAGAVAGWLRVSREPGLVVLNPILDPGATSVRQRLVLHGLRRAERVVFFTRGGARAAVRLGLDPGRVRFVPLGVRARRARPPKPGTFLLAAGRESRDWATLAEAARGLSTEVVAVGPGTLPRDGPLRVAPQRSREGFLELLEQSLALIVPLLPSARTAGQLAVLDAMAVGRAVVATRAQGTQDYVSPETGILVPPGDAASLRKALEQVLDADVASRMGAAALAAARGPFALEKFVAAVDAEAQEAATLAHRVSA